MKKIIYSIVMLMAMAMSANAATMITTPKGTPEIYAFDAEGEGWSGTTYTFSKKVVLYFDADTVYLSCLQDGFDYASKPVYVKGIMNAGQLVIPVGQLIYTEEGYGDIVLDCISMNPDSTYNYLENISFDMDGDEIALESGTHIAGHRIPDSDDEEGFVGYNSKVKFKKITAQQAYMPEGLAQQTYILRYTDPDDAPVNRGVKVAFDGDKVYMSGLAPDAQEDVVVGTIKNGVITVQGGQLIGDNGYYYLSLTSTSLDEDKNITEWYDNITFTINEDTSKITLDPSTALTEYFYGHYEEAASLRDVRFEKYTHDVAAKPSHPDIIDFYEDEDGEYRCFDLEIKSEDVDGNYINSEKLYYRMYKDGNLYTFKPAVYKNLKEDMTDIPYLFTDYEKGNKIIDFDIQYNVIRNIYIYEMDWTTMSFESVYKVDGQEMVSDRVSYNYIPDGIESVHSSESRVQSSASYNLAGQKVGSGYKGLVIKNGKKFVK